MLPAHYLAIKAAMLREAARRGVLPRSEARTMFRLDPSRALKVRPHPYACFEGLAECRFLYRAHPGDT